MKNMLFIAMLLVSVQFYAQPPGGGRGGSGQNLQGTNREVREFKASDVAGIIYYNEKEVIKKLKIKEEDKKLLMSKELQNYNSKIKEISFLNSETFTELNVVVKAAMSSGNRETAMKMRKKVEEIIKPVREEVSLHEEELNKNIESILSEKQLKKWLKYQSNKKSSLQPRISQNNEEGARSGRGNGGRRQ
ncbi:hypothetical protein [Polaribacter sargassicola]|uniref:hypothetical protein n=1 Tax=Polaribacter sargassicola TaxID=2836891 RepID=UPI001F42BB94|nr:hypothetical protein [Polaribacter sp. DS7-9]MCG1036993.1 hypothetical protein [Polaribacter sp. DS7-9]